MPSPVGHALGGLVFGWLVAGAPDRSADAREPLAPAGQPGPPGARRARQVLGRLRDVLLHPWTVGFAVLGALADADFALGIHSQQTHSLGAVAVVFGIAAFWGGRLDWRRGLACALAYGSHVLLDWLGSDTTPPIGIMALWPFTDGYYQSEFYVFDAISRRYWLPGFWAHNALAVVREVVVLGPACWLVWWLRRGPRATPSAASVERLTSALGR